MSVGSVVVFPGTILVFAPPAGTVWDDLWLWWCGPDQQGEQVPDFGQAQGDELAVADGMVPINPSRYR
jgi:hypothetical protein